MADDPPDGPDDLKTEFIFVKRGDPPPLEWMALHPGWVKFPAVMIPRDSPHHPNNRAYKPVSRPVAVEREAVAEAAPGPSGVAASVSKGRDRPLPPVPSTRHASDPIEAYRRSNDAVASYLAVNAALDACGFGHASGAKRPAHAGKSHHGNKHRPEASSPATKKSQEVVDTKAVIATARVGYGETAGLYPQKDTKNPKKDDPQSAADLQKARENIMDIAQRNVKVHHGQPQDPNNPIQKRQWDNNRAAARLSDGSLRGNYFFIRQNGVGNQRPPESAGFGQDGAPVVSYGPFINVGGGDVPRGNETYVDIYEH